MYQPCPFLQEMDMVDTNCSTAAKQEIEMPQEIAPFGQKRHGTVRLCRKTRSYPAIAKVIHTCQPSRIIRKSPGYDTNLPVSRTGRFISRTKSSFELFCALG